MEVGLNTGSSVGSDDACWVKVSKACFRLVLEVLGLAGPFVAARELLVDYADDNELEQIVTVMLVLGLVRWLIKEMYSSERQGSQSSIIRVAEGASTFILQVPGAMGAIWGGSDVLGLRDEHAESAFKWASYGAGILALPLWLMEVSKKRDEWLSLKGRSSQFLMVYSALVMFIQQVFGAGGAIWGPSEALDVRPDVVSDETVDHVAIGAMVLGLFYWVSEVCKMHADQGADEMYQLFPHLN